jgi:hypothetical protein
VLINVKSLLIRCLQKANGKLYKNHVFKNKNYNNKSRVTKQMIRQAIKPTKERMDKHTNHMQAK